MTEVTLKVMPRAESERTLLLRGLDDIRANQAMTAALGSPFDVSGAAHLTGTALRTTLGPLGEIAAPDESVTLIRAQGAEPCGVLIALDRQERGQGELSAAQEVVNELQLPVVAIAGLDDLLSYTADRHSLAADRQALLDYRARYGSTDRTR